MKRHLKGALRRMTRAGRERTRGEERKVKEEMGERARCALREAAMVVAAGRRAGSSKILFTIHAGVVRRALCRSVGRSVGRSVRLASRSRAMRANARAGEMPDIKGGENRLPPFPPFLMLGSDRKERRRLPMPNCHHSYTLICAAFRNN